MLGNVRLPREKGKGGEGDGKCWGKGNGRGGAGYPGRWTSKGWPKGGGKGDDGKGKGGSSTFPGVCVGIANK